MQAHHVGLCMARSRQKYSIIGELGANEGSGNV